MSQLRALLPIPAVMPIEGGSPVVKSLDVVYVSPRLSRHAFARRRPTWVMEMPVRIAPSHITGPTRRGRGCGAGLPSSSVTGGDGCYHYGSGSDSIHV